MTSTVDNICANIETKFTSIREIFAIYDNYDLDDEDEQIVSSSISMIDSLQAVYNTCTLDMLTEYYLTDDSNVKESLRDGIARAVKSNNIIGELDRLYKNYVRLRKIYKVEEPEIPRLAKLFETSVIDESFSDPGSDICTKCKVPYEIEEKTAEYVCKNCGHLEKMSGVVFEDEQFFYQEGQRTKHGKYDPIKHAKIWLERIQAKEMTDIPADVLNQIRTLIKRDQLWLNSISCDTIRKYLKQIKKTQYNNHIPLIRKLVTGLEPSQLTEHETQLVYMYLGTAIQHFSTIKKNLTNASKNDCPYHPFFIYKIIEQILKDPRHSTRRKDILSCIHLQSRETLIEHDRAWFAICDNIPEFTKIATDSRRR